MIRPLVATLAAASLAGGVASAVALSQSSHHEAGYVCADKVFAKVLGHKVPALESLHPCVGPKDPTSQPSIQAAWICTREWLDGRIPNEYVDHNVRKLPPVCAGGGGQD